MHQMTLSLKPLLQSHPAYERYHLFNNNIISGQIPSSIGNLDLSVNSFKDNKAFLVISLFKPLASLVQQICPFVIRSLTLQGSVAQRFMFKKGIRCMLMPTIKEYMGSPFTGME